MNDLKDRIQAFARETAGFDDCRVTEPRMDDERREWMRTWLGQGMHGDMAYLERHVRYKEDPRTLLSNVKTAIVIIKNYKNTPERELAGNFKIARYAVGRDYHRVLMERLKQVEAFILSERPDSECYLGVDSRPLDERGLAVKAGVGFQGRNTMVIQPGLGSYFFIGVILTTLELPPDSQIRTTCGTCRLCLDACPTDALLEDGSMDARLCISYLNIEKKDPVPREEIEQLRGWAFGCDICQEVCPFNKDQVPLTDWPEFRAEGGVGFEFLETHAEDLSEQSIPRTSAMHRSRKRVVPNVRSLRRGLPQDSR